MIRSTGIIRRIDSLGRVVIPVELRHMLGITAGTGVEVYLVGGDIVLEKYVPGCFFCGASEGLETYRGKRLCRECLRLLGERR